MATKHGSLRAAAASCIVGAAATALGGIAVQAIVQPATSVSHDRWSYPWSSAALIPISLLWAVLHVLVFYGVPTGVAVYGFCLLGLGVALYTEPTPTAHTRPLNAQGQYA
jgi:hypothetical protein